MELEEGGVGLDGVASPEGVRERVADDEQFGVRERSWEGGERDRREIEDGEASVIIPPQNIILYSQMSF